MNEVIQIDQQEMQEELKNESAVLVDIREELEFADFNIGGINIPAHLINERQHLLENFTTLILACSNGTRSHILSRVFLKKFPEKRILHLKEGIY